MAETTDALPVRMTTQQWDGLRPLPWGADMFRTDETVVRFGHHYAECVFTLPLNDGCVSLGAALAAAEALLEYLVWMVAPDDGQLLLAGVREGIQRWESDRADDFSEYRR